MGKSYATTLTRSTKVLLTRPAGVQLIEIARRESVPDAFIRTRAQLAFLSPKIQTAILDGSQPPELTLKRLVSVTHPLEWSEQERLFGF
ncbi:hypothetical protein [Ruegeria arenilitoris]|uniref:hypothetical protein n=1 Tax=Ruegeria arenilitoris TaxID=1173585 RepID=UPI001480CD37|nr:hypothetical protein [Ruegeria arenilitoris]